MVVVFWLLAAVIVYIYAGYPLLLGLLSAIGVRRPVKKSDAEPPVTLIISAFNEAEVIAEKIRNSLAIHYPRERLEVIVVSDASDDGTDAIVEQFAGDGVRLLRMNDRGGKTLGLNAAVRAARGEILVFSDANAMYEREALRVMVRNFSDPDVGAVVGESTYADAQGGAQQNESLYWKYETGIKRLETQIGSTVGGDGAIYAIRRALYRDMRADALSDFVNPMQIVMGGHRCIYEPEARSIEDAAEGFDKEFRRKVRIVNRAWRALWSVKPLLNPLRYGLFSLQIVSHKLLRWLAPAFLAAFFIVSAALAPRALLYQVAFGLQALFYLCAALGHLLRGRASLPRIVSIPYYFCLVNLASALGIIDAYRGKTYATWATVRAPGRTSSQ
jgi:cellulose synthase/poly-beta-1,6-N-acetylglucosamine synthase-like glycosyltransferase